MNKDNIESLKELLNKLHDHWGDALWIDASELVALEKAVEVFDKPEGEAPQAEPVTLHCSKCHSTTRHKDGTCTECGNAKFMMWAEIVQPIQVHASAAQQAEAGSPSARLTFILNELAKRFPHAHAPFAASPNELSYLEAIDGLASSPRRSGIS